MHEFNIPITDAPARVAEECGETTLRSRQTINNWVRVGVRKGSHKLAAQKRMGKWYTSEQAISEFVAGY